MTIHTHLCVGDVRWWLDALPAGIARCCITSPPYWGLRRYTSSADEIGIASLDTYLTDLAGVFDGVARVLRPDGVAWVNVGDTSVGSGGAGGDYGPTSRRAGQPRYRQGDPGELAGGQWADVPGRLVHELQRRGWRLRSRVTWDKGRCRPESLTHARRPGVASEPIFFLARARTYHFDAGQLHEPGDVWHFAPSQRRSGHQAPFPDELVARCATPTTVEGDLLLDPFAGSGTTLAWAAANGRHSIGIDLDERAAAMLAGRVPNACIWTPEHAAELAHTLAALHI